MVLQALHDELMKERAAREALKEVVSAAESMLRVARARIATLERQLKDTRAELEAARRKHKDLEQLVNRLALHHSHTVKLWQYIMRLHSSGLRGGRGAALGNNSKRSKSFSCLFSRQTVLSLCEVAFSSAFGIRGSTLNYLMFAGQMLT